MLGSSESWEPQQAPRRWHSRAGGGAVHSIKSGHMHCNKNPYSITSLAATTSVSGTLRLSDLAVLIAGKRGESRVISCAARSGSGLRIRCRHHTPALTLQQHTKHQSVRYQQQRNDRCGNEIGGAELPWR